MRIAISLATTLLCMACAYAADTVTTVNAVKSTVTLGGGKATYGAQGVAVDPASGLFYIALNGNIVAGCDGDTINGGTRPTSIGHNQVSLVDPSKANEIAVVPSGGAPVWPTVDSYRRIVYVANSGAGTVTAHDAASGAKLSTITVGGIPHLGALDFWTRLMVVGNTVSRGATVTEQNHASIVDTATGKVTRDFVSSPAVHGGAVDQLRHIAYYTAVGDGAITAIDTTTGLEIATGIPKSVYGSDFGNNNLMARQASSRLLFQANSQTSASGVLIVDETTLAAKGLITLGNGRKIWGLWVDEGSRLLFAVMPNNNEVGVVDLDTMRHVATIPVGQCPYAIAVDPVRQVGLVSNQGSPTVNASASIFDLCPVYAATGRSVSACVSQASGPSNLLATVDGSSLKLAWKQTAGTGATTKLQVGGYLTAAVDIPTSSEQLDVPTVPAGNYEVTLVTTDAKGTSALSNTVSLSFPGTCSAPQSPSNVLVTKSGRVVSITWDPPVAGAAPSEYRLNVSGATSGSFVLTTRSIGGSVPAGTYSISVEALNACGASTPSSTQTFAVS